MKRFLIRLRGLVGVSLLGATAGVLFGVGWGVLAQLGFLPRFYDAPLIGQLQVFGSVFGVIGTLVGGGFGLLLTTTSGRLTLGDLDPRRIAALGGFAGAVGPLLVLSFIGGWLPPAATVPIVLIGGGLGALGSVGVLRIAQMGAASPALEERPSDRLER